MSTKECACRDGERCNFDDDGNLCPLAQAEQDYWRAAWNNASPAERMSLAEVNAAMVDAGRGHLVGT